MAKMTFASTLAAKAPVSSRATVRLPEEEGGQSYALPVKLTDKTDKGIEKALAVTADDIRVKDPAFLTETGKRVQESNVYTSKDVLAAHRASCKGD